MYKEKLVTVVSKRIVSIDIEVRLIEFKELLSRSKTKGDRIVPATT